MEILDQLKEKFVSACLYYYIDFVYKTSTVEKIGNLDYLEAEYPEKFVVFIWHGDSYSYYPFLKGKKLVSKEYWKYALIISIPLIFHNLSGIVNAQFDRILINKYIGASETGIYSFAYNVGMIITVLWTSTNQAWVPWFFEKMGKEDHINIRKRAKNFRDFFTLVYILILFLSPEIIKIMADEAYWEGLYIIPFIFMAYYFNLMYSFEANIEFFTKKLSIKNFA